MNKETRLALSVLWLVLSLTMLALSISGLTAAIDDSRMRGEIHALQTQVAPLVMTQQADAK